MPTVFVNPDAVLGAVGQHLDAMVLVDGGLAGGLDDVEELVAVGPKRVGDLVVGHDVMKDAIDAARRVLAGVGGDAVAVLAKAEASPSGVIRGRRHTMLDDSDIHSTRHARALVGGVLAGVIGDTMLYVSGGAEHQGPAGGGPVAIIGRV